MPKRLSHDLIHRPVSGCFICALGDDPTTFCSTCDLRVWEAEFEHGESVEGFIAWGRRFWSPPVAA